MAGSKQSAANLKKIKQLNKQYKDLNEELKKLHSKVQLVTKLKDDLDRYQRNNEAKKAIEAQQQYESALFYANKKKEQLLKKYGKNLRQQAMDFFRGPQTSHEESVQEWIIRTYPAVRLLMNSDFMRFNPIPELTSLSNKMPWSQDLAITFFSDNASDYVFFGSDNVLKAGEFYIDKIVRSQEDYNSFIRDSSSKVFLKSLATSLKKYTNPKPEPDYYNNDKAKLDGFVANLKKAKTTYNSDEYKAIYNLVEQLNKTEKAPKTETMDLSRKENYTVKLFAIKNAIDAYIQHKAKDGVKRNVYNKLAAVEELDKFVVSKIKELKPETFWAGKNKIDASTIKSGNFSKQFSDEGITNNLKNAKKEYGFTGNKTECRNVLDCMGKIIQTANKSKVGKQQMRDLEQMRQDFFTKPGKDITPVKKKQTVSQSSL